MNRHFITEIEIENIRNLKNIKIELDKEKPRHLLLTGKNGSGKTTTLQSIKNYLTAIQMDLLGNIKIYKNTKNELEKKLIAETNEDRKMSIKNELNNIIRYINDYSIDGLNIYFNCDDKIISPLYKGGEFILAYYGSSRATKVEVPRGAEKVNLKEVYQFEDNPSQIFLKYLVDLKTQQSFARNEGDMEVVENIETWFNKFENAMRKILDDKSISLKFDYRNYDFKILQKNREPYNFNELSDGYSSILNIVSDLILRIDKNRAGTKRNYNFDTEGIVLIDELEMHLHIELQKAILPFLCEFFPSIQFIVTTHSPFVLTSTDNAVIYDLEKNIRVEGLGDYSYEGIVEGYFEVDSYSNELKEKIDTYRELAFRDDLNDEERALRAELRIDIKNSANDLAKELKAEFEEIENRRKNI